MPRDMGHMGHMGHLGQLGAQLPSTSALGGNFSRPSSYDSAALASALISNRDASVGTYHEPTRVPNQLELDGDENLRDWFSEVRSTLYLQALTEGVHIDVHDGEARLWHLSVSDIGGTPMVNATKLMGMTRPSQSVFKEQLRLVHGSAYLRTDRMTEILTQLNGPIDFLAATNFFRPERAKWTLELMTLAQDFAQFVGTRFKHAMSCRRPIEYSAQIQPIIMTPGHGTLPSGHAYEVSTMVRVLLALMRSKITSDEDYEVYRNQLVAFASRIAENRHVAGVHFPVDSIAGFMLGVVLGDYLVARLSGTPENPGITRTVSFHGGEDASAELNNIEFDVREFFDLKSQPVGANGDAFIETTYVKYIGTGPTFTEAENVLDFLWRNASDEWDSFIEP